MALQPPDPTPARCVSPLGASKFERPYTPPKSQLPDSNGTSESASPTTPATGSEPSHYSKPSITSTARTSSTAPTSVDSFGPELKSVPAPVCVLPGDQDSLFDRFPAEPELPVDHTDECPDRATLAAVQDIPLYDSEGNWRPFGSLYGPEFATHQRQLVIFVRHFYCGACQAYLKALTESISMRDYFTIPIPTSIIVIGCGQPHLIPQYKKFSGNCPFPIFADPSRTLFKKLGMKLSFSLGKQRPEYMKDISILDWINGQGTTVRNSLKDPNGIRKRDIIRGGHPMQVGGEFLFEDGHVLWCHRMTNYRNHAEVSLVRKLLELDE